MADEPAIVDVEPVAVEPEIAAEPIVEGEYVSGAIDPIVPAPEVESEPEPVIEPAIEPVIEPAIEPVIDPTSGAQTFASHTDEGDDPVREFEAVQDAAQAAAEKIGGTVNIEAHPTADGFEAIVKPLAE
jgi:hypothetical protein